MTELVRQEIMTAADLVVVKVGTRVLTHPDGTLDDDRVASISGQLARLWQAGRRVVLVSSGAVAAAISVTIPTIQTRYPLPPPSVIWLAATSAARPTVPRLYARPMDSSGTIRVRRATQRRRRPITSRSVLVKTKLAIENATIGVPLPDRRRIGRSGDRV